MPGKPKDRRFTNREWLQEKYRKKTLREIARETGLSHEAVRLWMVKLGIPRRAPMERPRHCGLCDQAGAEHVYLYTAGASLDLDLRAYPLCEQCRVKHRLPLPTESPASSLKDALHGRAEKRSRHRMARVDRS